MQIDTRYTNLVVTNPGGNVTGTLTEPAPTITNPWLTTTGVTTAGDGVISMGFPISQASWSGGMLANSVKLIPFGVGSNGNTFTLKVYAWDRIQVSGNQPLWVPTLLASFTCTHGSTMPGVANTDVNASQTFCSTIALVVGNANISNEIISPATTSEIASIILDAKGAALVETRFTVGTNTSCNCLAKVL